MFICRLNVMGKNQLNMFHFKNFPYYTNFTKFIVNTVNSCVNTVHSVFQISPFQLVLVLRSGLHLQYVLAGNSGSLLNSDLISHHFSSNHHRMAIFIKLKWHLFLFCNQCVCVSKRVIVKDSPFVIICIQYQCNCITLVSMISIRSFLTPTLAGKWKPTKSDSIHIHLERAIHL